MPIPDFQTLMLPLLKVASTHGETTVQEAREILAKEFALTEEEREQLLPSGRQRTFSNRVAWASVYLRQAGLLSSPGRGRIQITEEGRTVLAGGEAGQHLGRSGDDGVDGVIREDKLGLDVVYLQAKRWADQAVSRPDIQAFAGSLEGQRARKGVFITTSHFTAEAKEFTGRIEKRIVLIDGKQLARLMIEHGVGVTTIRTYALQQLDETFFDEAADA